MTLSSQSSRPGFSRREMSRTGRKRRLSRWLWLLFLALALLVIVFAVRWLTGHGEPNNGAAASPFTPAVGAADAHDATAGKATGKPADAASQSTEAAGRSTSDAASEAPVKTLTLSRDSVETTGGTAGDPPSADGLSADASPDTPAATSSRAHAVGAGSVSQAASSSPPPSTRGDVSAKLKRGLSLIDQGRQVEGRGMLSNLLFNHANQLSPADAESIRQTLTKVNQTLIFSPTIVPDDPLEVAHRVQSGEVLARLAPTYHVPYQFIVQINGINPSRLQVGQTIKMIRGPFHAIVDKSDYRIDLYLKTETDQRIYVRSFPVGLGKADSTPIGRWIVERGRKAVNPGWTNPRTNARFAPDDPKNPIGEYWMALKGIGPHTKGRSGYGIHGTIDPDSVGTQCSMGCIRLRHAAIKQVFHMLEGGQSTVQVRR